MGGGGAAAPRWGDTINHAKHRPAQRMRKEETVAIKVVVVGDCGTGKSTLCASFINERAGGEPVATIGVDFAYKEVRHASYGTILFNLWDTAGAEKFNSISMTATYYRHADAVVYLFDVTSAASFHNVRHVWQRRIRAATGIHEHYRAVLVGNKCDLAAGGGVGGDAGRREVSVAEALTLAGELGVEYVELSSLHSSHEEIRQPFLLLATELIDNGAYEALNEASSIRRAIRLGEGKSEWDDDDGAEQRRCCQS